MNGKFLVVLAILLLAGVASAQNATTTAASNTTAPADTTPDPTACPDGLIFDPSYNSCIIPCPLPLLFNPSIFNCSFPCYFPFRTQAEINGMRITMAVMAWANVIFLSAILILYTVRVPKRWTTFPGNLMLTMLSVSLPYQLSWLFSTGHTLNGWLCKNKYESYATSARGKLQGGFLIFWAIAGAAHLLVLALQLFLSVNNLVKAVTPLVKQIIYFSFIFGSAFVVVMCNQFIYDDVAWGTTEAGGFSIGSRNGLMYTFLIPLTVFIVITSILMIWSMGLVILKSGFRGLFKQRRLLFFNGSYLFFIWWIIIYLFWNWKKSEQTEGRIIAWIDCSSQPSTFNSPKCNPGAPTLYWYDFISNCFFVLISSALCVSYSWNSETRKLLYNLPVEAAQTFGLSRADSIGPTTSSASRTDPKASTSTAEISAHVPTEEW